MARLAFHADEHVPQAVVSALRSNGYTVGTATEEPGSETVDTELLARCADEGRVLITNDRDFVELSSTIDHAGIILYSTQGLPPGEFARGIRRIDRQFGPEAVRNTIAWLEEWL